MKTASPTLFARRAVSAGLALALAAALAACTNAATEATINQRAAKAEQELTQARQPQSDAKHYDPLVVSDKIWSGNASFRMHRGIPLPARFETSHGIAIVSGAPMTLRAIATAITTQTGIPVRVDNMMVSAAPAAAPSSSGPSAGGLSSSMPSVPPNPFGGGGLGSVGSATPSARVETSSAADDSGSTMPISYQGSLSGLLEKVAGFFDVDWNYDGTSVDIHRMETRVFMVEALPQTAATKDNYSGAGSSGSSSSSGSGGNSSGGGSSSGGSSGGSGSGGSSNPSSITGSMNQQTTYDATIKYWDGLKETLTSMLGGVGSVVTSPSSGEVAVTTTPDVMRTVAAYLEQENRRISSQIAINVEVFSISLSQGEDFNTNLTGILNKLGKIANLHYTGPAAPSSVGGLVGPSSFSITILNPNNATYANPLNDVIQAMSSIGNVTQVAQFPMVTLSNRPVSRFVGTTQWFVPQLQSNTVTGTSSSSSTSATAEPITSGFTLQMTPRLLEDGRIIMQYSLNIQNVSSIQCFNICTGIVSASCNTAGGNTTSGGCVIQEPVTTNRSFIQQSVLRSGSTLMIGGVDEHDVSQNAQGVGSPYDFLLGGGTSNANDHTMVFVAITPQVLDDTGGGGGQGL